MRKSDLKSSALLLALAVSMSACSVSVPFIGDDEPAPKTEDLVVTVSSFESPEVADAVDRLSGSRTLFVFDIDNTVLENPDGQFLGSAQWYDWQSDLPDTDSRKLNCLLQFQGAAYLMGHMQATEEGLSASFIAALQAAGQDVMALTARGPDFRPATERELKRAGIDFKKTMPQEFAGVPGRFKPDISAAIPVPRDASYQNGIAMLAGQHKGAALVDLLTRIGAGSAYDVIVFFDDDSKNTNAMLEVFSEDSRGAMIFRYTGVVSDLSQVDLAKTVRGQEAIAAAYAHFLRDQGCD